MKFLLYARKSTDTGEAPGIIAWHPDRLARNSVLLTSCSDELRGRMSPDGDTGARVKRSHSTSGSLSSRAQTYHRLDSFLHLICTSTVRHTCSTMWRPRFLAERYGRSWRGRLTAPAAPKVKEQARMDRSGRNLPDDEQRSAFT